MTEMMWYLTRASGFVALALMLAAIVGGLVFSGREGGRRPRPAWWLDLHRGLGGYALIFTGLHLVTAFGADLGVGLTTIFVPGAASYSRDAYTFGVVAFYAMAVTVFTTWPKRRLRRALWHALHLLAIPATVLAAVHAYQLGTDASTPLALWLTAWAGGLAMYPVGLRVTGIARRLLPERGSPPLDTDDTAPLPPAVRRPRVVA